MRLIIRWEVIGLTGPMVMAQVWSLSTLLQTTIFLPHGMIVTKAIKPNFRNFLFLVFTITFLFQDLIKSFGFTLSVMLMSYLRILSYCEMVAIYFKTLISEQLTVGVKLAGYLKVLTMRVTSKMEISTSSPMAMVTTEQIKLKFRSMLSIGMMN